MVLSLKSALGPAMPFRVLSFLPEAKATEIEGGFGARSQHKALPVPQRLGKTLT